MELTSDLIAIQSILSKLVKETGDFTRIIYGGDNEDALSKVLSEIDTFLKSKNYLKKCKPNEVFNKQLEELVLFLALNTKFKNPLEMNEYAHLTNITPPLSKCLFTNIIHSFNFYKLSCCVIDKFPIQFSTELLEELLNCLRKCPLDDQLDNISNLLKAVVKKLAITNYKGNEDIVDNMCEVTYLYLYQLSGVNSDQLSNLNRDQIYIHMGYCLRFMFDLLLDCNRTIDSLSGFIRNVINANLSISRNISLNVFCTWAEIDIDDQSLQMVICNKAYDFIETYQKVPEAKELINVLGPIATKPKSLSEQIFEADIGTMVKKIYKNDKDQISWFRALLQSQFLNNKQALECIQTWSHLCGQKEASIILDLCVKQKSKELGDIFIKSASNLPLKGLKDVITAHFYRHKFSDLPCRSIDETLIHILNKLKEDNHNKDDLTKDILLLFVQQPEFVLGQLYNECLKNSFYLNFFKGIFDAIEEIVKINSMGVNVLLNQVKINKPNCNNVNNYIELLKTLNEIGFFTNDDVVLKFLYQILKDSYSSKMLEDVDFVLQIYIGVAITIPLVETNMELVKLLLIIMNEFRCSFLDFDGAKQQIVRHIVSICCDICAPTYTLELDLDMDEENEFTRFYKQLVTSGRDKSLFHTFCNEFRIENYRDCVSALLKMLPSAVSREWSDITNDVIHLYGNDKCCELITDALILLALLAETRIENEDSSVLFAMRYCVQNYGVIMQQKILSNSTLETEVCANKHITRLLVKLPVQVKEDEGMSLVNIMTDRSLKSLATDKKFLSQLILIKNAKICQALHQKIVS
ncbi:unnamed protein product [Phyllotreta striolata]|uniref:Uncharacterized protein n=1 Tax=Phyllotreta striolata TaxID=444603 RepID=A0A9N9TZK3_PHYSR|nr:unnamed protein product [Phyllotreta striolata]